MELFSSWTGSDFLLFYIVLLGLSVLGAWWIPASLREPGRRGVADDVESVALLAGGRARYNDSLLTGLYVRGALTKGEKGKFNIAARDAAVSPAGQALLALNEPFSPAEAKEVLAVHADRVAARLKRCGLLMRDAESTRLCWLSITPFAAPLLIGLYRQRAGEAVGEAIGFLVILLVLTVALAIIRFVRSDPRTVAGIALVHDLREKNSRFSIAPRPEEVPMAVALFGTGVLVGTPWEPIHAMRQKDSGGDGGGSGRNDSDRGDAAAAVAEAERRA